MPLNHKKHRSAILLVVFIHPGVAYHKHAQVLSTAFSFDFSLEGSILSSIQSASSIHCRDLNLFTLRDLRKHDAIGLMKLQRVAEAKHSLSPTTIMLTVLAFLGLCALAQASVSPLTVQDSSQIILAEDVRVPVVLGVMSRCPDAMLCEAVWDRVLQRVGDKVDISLSFIAKYVHVLKVSGTPRLTRDHRPNASDPTFAVTCMHGVEECAGNVYELCVAKYHPASEWWPFLQCQNFQGREQIGLPDTAVRCATAAGFEWEIDKASQCAGDNGQGQEGVKLLQESVKNSIALGIQ